MITFIYCIWHIRNLRSDRGNCMLSNIAKLWYRYCWIYMHIVWRITKHYSLVKLCIVLCDACILYFLFVLVPLHYCSASSELVGGYIGFTLSVRPSIRPASRVCSIVPKVLVGSISYLYILSGNFRRCVAFNVPCKISKFEFLAIFFKFVTLTLSYFDLGSDVNH